MNSIKKKSKIIVIIIGELIMEENLIGGSDQAIEAKWRSSKTQSTTSKCFDRSITRRDVIFHRSHVYRWHHNPKLRRHRSETALKPLWIRVAYINNSPEASPVFADQINSGQPWKWKCIELDLNYDVLYSDQVTIDKGQWVSNHVCFFFT